MTDLIKDSELSVRTKHCLASEGIKTFSNLTEKTEAEVRRIPNVGVNTLNEINAVLKGRSCKLREPRARYQRPESTMTQSHLKKIMNYNSVTGELRWSFDEMVAPRVRGHECRKPDSDGYFRVGIKGRTYSVHRLAWLFYYGKFPDGFLDHIDGRVTNNAINNLREVTNSSNLQNQRKAHKDKKYSNLIGAHFNIRYKTWCSRIMVNGKTIRLGQFESAELAHQAYVAAKRVHHESCTI